MGVEPLLDIIHEDAELLAINKPADLVCHPSKNGPMDVSSLPLNHIPLTIISRARPNRLNCQQSELAGRGVASVPSG